MMRLSTTPQRLWLSLAVYLSLLPVPFVHADYQVAGSAVHPPVEPTGSPTYAQLLNSGFGIFLWIATAAAVAYLVLAGWRYITAAGDTEKAAAARAGLVSAVIGIILLSGSLYIFNASKSLGTNPTDSTLSGL